MLRDSHQKLNKDIDFLRNQMIASGVKKGLLHPETIKYSQELDELIYKYQCIAATKTISYCM